MQHGYRMSTPVVHLCVLDRTGFEKAEATLTLLEGLPNFRGPLPSLRHDPSTLMVLLLSSTRVVEISALCLGTLAISGEAVLRQGPTALVPSPHMQPLPARSLSPR